MAAERAMTYLRAAWIRLCSDEGKRSARCCVDGNEAGTHGRVRRHCAVQLRVATQRIRRLLTSAAAFHAKRGEAYDQALALNDLGLAAAMHDDFDAAMSAFEQGRKLYELAARPEAGADPAEHGLGQLQLRTIVRGAAALLTRAGAAAAGTEPDALRRRFSTTALSPIRSRAITTPRCASWARHWPEPCRAGPLVAGDDPGQHRPGVPTAREDRPTALDFYTQSLALGDAALSSSRRNTLTKMATLLRDKGEYARALATRKEALALASSASSRVMVSIYLAADYRAAGNSRSSQSAGGHPGRNPTATCRLRSCACHAGARPSCVVQGTLRCRPSPEYREAAMAMFHDTRCSRARVRLGARHGANAVSPRSLADHALRELARTLQLAEELRRQSANPELPAKLLEKSRPAFDLQDRDPCGSLLRADREPAQGATRPRGIASLRNRLALEPLPISRVSI